MTAKQDSEDGIIATILKEGRGDRRKELSKKLGRKCSEGCYKRKTKIDELRAEKKALKKRLRRSEDKVKQLKTFMAENKPE